jgi:hypothetical protein
MKRMKKFLILDYELWIEEEEFAHELTRICVKRE